MGRSIAIGFAWWLAAAYGLQFGAAMYGFAPGLAPVLALPIAIAVAMTRTRAVRRPADLRRIYQPREADGMAGEPSLLTGR
jgi:hypothetical protein